MSAKRSNGSSKALVAVTAAAAALKMDEAAVEVVRSAVAPDFNDVELAFFMWQCNERGLNPLAKEVYAFKAGGKICVGLTIDGMRKKADESGRYMPGPTRYEYDDQGNLSDAFVTIRIWDNRTEQWMDFEERAHMTEFRANTPIWKEKPHVMLAKCAEARGLRRAFPAALGNTYEPAEMDIQAAVTPQSPASMADAVRQQAAGKPIDVKAERLDEAKATETHIKPIWNTYCHKRGWTRENIPGSARDEFLGWIVDVLHDKSKMDKENLTIADTDKLFLSLQEFGGE